MTRGDAMAPGFKFCAGPCGRLLPSSDFYPLRRWLQPRCKGCHRVAERARNRTRSRNPVWRAQRNAQKLVAKYVRLARSGYARKAVA
jgi:hypothetical protein